MEIEREIGKQLGGRRGNKGKGREGGGQQGEAWRAWAPKAVPAHLGMLWRQHRPQQSKETQKGAVGRGMGAGGRAGMSHFLGQGKGKDDSQLVAPGGSFQGNSGVCHCELEGLRGASRPEDPLATQSLGPNLIPLRLAVGIQSLPEALSARVS